MPDRDYYQGRNLADRLRALAEHHFELRTRHISRFEYEMLLGAAEVFDHGLDGQDQDGTKQTEA